MLSFTVFASEEHHIRYEPKETTNITNEYSIIYQYNVDGIAASMAMAGIDFTQNVKKPQFGCSGSWYEAGSGRSSEAGACGAAKRLCLGDTCGLGMIKIAKENRGGKGITASFVTTF